MQACRKTGKENIHLQNYPFCIVSAMKPFIKLLINNLTYKTAYKLNGNSKCSFTQHNPMARSVYLK